MDAGTLIVLGLTAVVVLAVGGALLGLVLMLWPIAIPVVFGLTGGPVGAGVGIIIVLLLLGLARN